MKKYPHIQDFKTYDDYINNSYLKNKSKRYKQAFKLGFLQGVRAKSLINYYKSIEKNKK